MSLRRIFTRACLGVTVLLLTLGLQITPQANAGVILDVGSQIDTFQGNTRGYFFVSPTDFFITGAKVSTDASSLSQDIEIVRLNVMPPSYSSSTNDFTSLFRTTDNASPGFVNTGAISVSTGDIIGVLGSRGPNSINSYGVGSYGSDIFGNAVLLQRLGMQNDLRNVSASNLWTEDFFIGRVELMMSQSVGVVPEPTSALIFAGVGLLGFCPRRKRQR